MRPVNQAIPGHADDFRESEVDQDGRGLQVLNEERGGAGDGEFHPSAFKRSGGKQGRVKFRGGGLKGQEDSDRAGEALNFFVEGFEILKNSEGLWPVILR